MKLLRVLCRFVLLIWAVDLFFRAVRRLFRVRFF
jgi:hypothetical protein